MKLKVRVCNYGGVGGEWGVGSGSKGLMTSIDNFLGHVSTRNQLLIPQLNPPPPHKNTHTYLGTKVIGAESIADLCSKLKRPRKVMLLVKAGSAVDDFIAQILPHLEAGDIIIDGGNSHFPDTIRRCKELEAKGLLFVGAGVSGGEEGARYGPSLMPGGSPAAW